MGIIFLRKDKCKVGIFNYILWRSMSALKG